MKLLLILLAAAAWGQTKVTPAQLNGTGVPAANCVVGQRYFRTDATAGQNDYLCTVTNTWTLANIDAVLGASSLTLAQAVPFVTSSGVLTDDPYFTYTPIPGSPVAGTTFYRTALSSSSAGTPYFSSNIQGDVAATRNITAISATPTSDFYLVGVLSNLTLTPASDWANTDYIQAYGSIGALAVPAAVSNPIGQLVGVGGFVRDDGSGTYPTLYGGQFISQYAGSDTASTVKGVSVRAEATGSGTSNVMGGLFTTFVNATTSSTTGLHTSVGVVGGTTTNAYGIRLDKTDGGTITNKWGISDETGWPSRLLGKVAIGPSNSAAPTDTLYVKDATASTGATSVSIDIGAGQSSTSTVLTLAGVIRFNGQNTTGAGSAALGANSPAVTNTAPYTWIRAVSSDGSAIYIPAWK